MSRYKLNVFHLHLMDDQDCRIQIKELTGLTKVDAWRMARTGHFNSFEFSCPSERAMNGGYYKQEDIREIVAYSKRCFNIIVLRLMIRDIVFRL